MLRHNFFSWCEMDMNTNNDLDWGLFIHSNRMALESRNIVHKSYGLIWMCLGPFWTRTHLDSLHQTQQNFSFRVPLQKPTAMRFGATWGCANAYRTLISFNGFPFGRMIKNVPLMSEHAASVNSHAITIHPTGRMENRQRIVHNAVAWRVQGRSVCSSPVQILLTW